MVVRPRITTRSVPSKHLNDLSHSGIHPLLAQLYASRGVSSSNEVHQTLPQLLRPEHMYGISRAAELLAEAILKQQRLLIVADYDCDGATACAVGIRALKQMGALVDYFVPNRFETGYGLSPAVVDLACQHPSGKPDIIITVDNGIASIDGVAYAKQQGIDVIVTDHHLPGDLLPEALAIVNPNQGHCEFASKNLAGVGVIFYVMLALRAELRRRQHFTNISEPRLDSLLDLVALGTIADVVKLDSNNRLIVAQGLQRMRAGRAQPGLSALFAVAGRQLAEATCFDLGFTIGPRINAAGRLADMSLGIRCLCTDDPSEAARLAKELDQINQERKEIELKMRDQALIKADMIVTEGQAALCVYDPEWHQGVIGLVASKVKDRHFRPTIAFAKGGTGELKGSGRSIPGVHLRDAIDLVSKKHPQIITKFGGHAMAAGLSIHEAHYALFEEALSLAVQTLTGQTTFEPTLETDGSLDMQFFNTKTAELLETHVWGSGFPQPLFYDEFEVVHQRLVGEKHLKLRLTRAGQMIDAIWFNHQDTLNTHIKAAYRLDINQWQGQSSLQLLIDYAH